jgi:hypothetical protein
VVVIAGRAAAFAGRIFPRATNEDGEDDRVMNFCAQLQSHPQITQINLNQSA